MVELLAKAIEDLCESYPTCLWSKMRWTQLLRNGQYRELYHKLNYYIDEEYWTPQQQIVVLRLCGYEPKLRRDGDKFYWYISLPTICRVRKADFDYASTFDRCLLEIQKLPYRQGLKSTDLPDEISEHIISFVVVPKPLEDSFDPMNFPQSSDLGIKINPHYLGNN